MPSPHHATNAATKGIVDELAERLRLHRSGVYSWGEDPEKDRYSRFIQVYLITADLKFEQSEAWYKDFTARRAAILHKRQDKRVQEPKALASFNEAAKDVVNGYLSDKADHEKMMDIARAEDALRELSAQIMRRGMTPAEVERDVRENAGL
jgi:hypothetical protein